MQKKVIVLASGEGSNFDAIVKSDIVVNKVICNNPKANIIKRAKTASVPVAIIDPADQHGHGIGWIERRILEEIPEDTDLIVLAGFMRILSPYFCEYWADKIINIHPSILPAFAGTCHAIKEAYDYGCKVFGVTIHWVTPEIDAGPIIAQRAIHKFEDDQLEDIIKKVRSVEHYLYPKTIKELIK
jgi:phosphoribosylglycinamide formyltransferase-1